MFEGKEKRSKEMKRENGKIKKKNKIETSVGEKVKEQRGEERGVKKIMG